MSAPTGAILNAPKPAPVCIRHVIGQMLPDVVFGCLRQIIPDRVPAEGTSCLWNLNVRGETQSGAGGNYGFTMAVTSNGGTGARPDKDGLSATAYPSGVRGTPVEIAESQTPLIFWKKELRPDFGGAGRTQGGHGQIIEIEQRHRPAVGYPGGVRPHRSSGARARRRARRRGRLCRAQVRARRCAARASSWCRRATGWWCMTPGGGGIGAPDERAAERVARDLADELVSEETARDLYGYTPVKAAE